MYAIRYTLTIGQTRITRPLGDMEAADRWRREMLRDPQILTAVVVPVEPDPLALAA
jgi:hypothetical protein